MSEYNTPKIEPLADVLTADFRKFFTENKYNVGELRQAYYLLCDVYEGADKISDKVQILHKKMDDLSKEGFPIDRFARIIEILEEEENSVAELEEFVSSFPVSDKEKEMITSIAKKSRSGDFQCFVDDQEVMKVEIPKDVDSKQIAAELNVILREFLSGLNEDVLKQRRVSFWFEER